MLFQPIVVNVPLYDYVEREAFGKLMVAIDEYRMTKAMGSKTPPPVAEKPAATTEPSEEIVDAEYEQDEKIVATITAEGAVKPVKEADLTEATQKYLKKHGVEKTFELVREFGVQKVTDVKDPVKRALLFQKLVEGVK